MTRLIVAATMALMAHPAPALDLDLYADILQAHTRETDDLAAVRVDYDALRGPAAADWERLVAGVESSDPASLRTRDGKLAYWINVYNILAIDVVVKNDPDESIRDVGSFLRPVWKKPAGRIAGKVVTLHEIEHEILRPMGDPRIHGAIVCASLSCPPLLREPYRVRSLDAQLDANLRTWLRQPDKGVAIDRARKRVALSKIFDWFEADFESAGGALPFVARYLRDEDARWLDQNGADASIAYLDYDWSLNRL